VEPIGPGDWLGKGWERGFVIPVPVWIKVNGGGPGIVVAGGCCHVFEFIYVEFELSKRSQ
jgi:hypothetical protein